MYVIHVVYFSSLHNFVMFKDTCIWKWDLNVLPLKPPKGLLQAGFKCL